MSLAPQSIVGRMLTLFGTGQFVYLALVIALASQVRSRVIYAMIFAVAVAGFLRGIWTPPPAFRREDSRVAQVLLILSALLCFTALLFALVTLAMAGSSPSTRP